VERRKFLKGLCAAGTVATSSTAVLADSADTLEHHEFDSVLMDAKRCIGCRDCEAACAAENGLPIPDTKDKSVFEEIRDTTPDEWTVVNMFDTEAGPVFVKKQCMHCNQAACSTACLTEAMKKTEEGPVIWRESKCMGCRYCMVSCPFNIPKFEYDSANPKIQKCIFCYELLAKGEAPACVQSCPVDALTFGPRREIVREAHSRLYNDPYAYHHHIYGEEEVGGTGWVYVSPVPFEEIGFRTDLGNDSVPELTQSFLYAVPVVFLLWPVFLNSIRRKDNGETLPAAIESAETARGES
jgi:formate dehydrogenase iron-sulfur subunit